MKSELPPKHARLMGLAMLIFLAAFCAFVVFLAGEFPWILSVFVAVATPMALYLLLWGPHVFFSLDDDSIAWSKNTKQHPVTRIPTIEIKEVHLIETGDDDMGRTTYRLMIVDSTGGIHRVETCDREPETVYRILKIQCPSASFHSVPFAMRNLLPGIPADKAKIENPTVKYSVEK
jgi:hypothetical protein